MTKNILIFALTLASIFLWGTISFAESLGDVDIQFCNNLSGQLQSWSIVSGNILYYRIGLNQLGDICYTVSNASLQDAWIKISFVDGTFTNDQRQNKACLSDADTQYFGQYVTGYEALIAISWGQLLQKNAKFIYPSWTDGIYHGCMVYSIVDPTTQSGGQDTSFTILMRKARFVDILVGDHLAAAQHAISFLKFNPASGENLSSNPIIRIYKDSADDKYVLQFQIQNTSSIDQKVSITGSISNFIAYKKIFTEPRKILRGETLLITKKIDEIPWYNMHIKLKTSFVPEINPIFGGEQFTEGWSFSTSTNIWIFDTITIVTLIGLMLLLGLFTLLIMLLKKQKSWVKKQRLWAKKQRSWITSPKKSKKSKKSKK